MALKLGLCHWILIYFQDLQMMTFYDLDFLLQCQIWENSWKF